MREIRQSGSEGGGTLTGPSYPYNRYRRSAAIESAISSQPLSRVDGEGTQNKQHVARAM